MEAEARAKAPPFCYVLGGGALSLGLSMCVVTPPPFRQPGYLSSSREVHGLCAPASRRVCLYRGAGAPERTPTILLSRMRVIYMPHGHLSGPRRAICMPGDYSLHTNFPERR